MAKSESAFDIKNAVPFRRILFISLVPVGVLGGVAKFHPTFYKMFFEGGAIIFMASLALSSLYFFAKRRELGYVKVEDSSVLLKMGKQSYLLGREEVLKSTFFRLRRGGSVLRPAVKIQIPISSQGNVELSASQVDLEALLNQLNEKLNISIEEIHWGGLDFLGHLLKS